MVVAKVGRKYPSSSSDFLLRVWIDFRISQIAQVAIGERTKTGSRTNKDPNGQTQSLQQVVF